MHDPALDSTASLLARVRSGDGDARARLFARCLPLLRRWAHGRLPLRARGVADTDDLVQVTLLNALNAVDRFDSEHKGAFLSYLRTVLMNVVRDEARRAQAQPRREQLSENLGDEAASVVEVAIGQQTLDAYERALAGLTDAQRDAVVLRLEFTLTYPEIALELELTSADAARMLVARGVARLADAMP